MFFLLFEYRFVINLSGDGIFDSGQQTVRNNRHAVFVPEIWLGSIMPHQVTRGLASSGTDLIAHVVSHLYFNLYPNYISFMFFSSYRSFQTHLEFVSSVHKFKNRPFYNFSIQLDFCCLQFRQNNLYARIAGC